MTAMRGLFSGSSELIQDIDWSLFKDSFMSSGGTTAADYAALEDDNVRATCMNATKKAFKRAKEL